MTNIGWSGERVRRNDGSVLVLDVVVLVGVVLGARERGVLTVTIAVGDGEGVCAALASGPSWPPQELSRHGSRRLGNRTVLRDLGRIIGSSILVGGGG
ncbi:hypothetical protein, partial [Xanthomonas axonopodis]